MTEPFVGADSIPVIWFGGSLFVFSVLLAGYLTPGYSHVNQSISELGARGARHGWIVRWVGFVSLGLGFILFACQSAGLLTNRVPAVVFFLTGVATIVAGIFLTDPGNRRDTRSGKIHAGAVSILMLLLSFTPFLLAMPALYRNPPPGWFSVFSLCMGIPTLTMLVFTAVKRDRRQPLPGLYQRFLLALHYIWWFVFTLVLKAAQLS